MKRPFSAARSSSDTAEPLSSCSSAEQPATSLRSFFPSAARSSSDVVEPPSSCRSVEQSATSLRSAEQPASRSHGRTLSIHDVQRWMAEEPFASCSNAEAQRIREAVAVLSRSKPRQEDVCTACVSLGGSSSLLKLLS